MTTLIVWSKCPPMINEFGVIFVSVTRRELYFALFFSLLLFTFAFHTCYSLVFHAHLVYTVSLYSYGLCSFVIQQWVKRNKVEVKKQSERQIEKEKEVCLVQCFLNNFQ